MVWIKPWKMTEGFLIGGSLILAGLLLQIVTGPIDWTLLAFPINFVLLIFLLLALGTIFAFRKRVYAFEWMMHYGAAVPCLVYASVLTVIMGLTPQVRAEGIPWISQMLSFWPFVMIWIWLMIISGLATLNHLSRFSIKEIPFIVNHLGVFIAVVCAALGSADIQKLRMTVRTGATEWRAQDNRGKIQELDIALELHRFTIDEWPPKLMIMDNSSGKIYTEKAMVIDENIFAGELRGWKIKILDRLPSAAAVSTPNGIQYEEWNSAGAVFATRIEAVRGDSLKTGWLSCGSFRYPQQYLKLSAEETLIMPEREPKRFSSEVSVYTKDGKNIHGIIEVNKALKINGWKIYQSGYDERLGKWSDTSVFELVKDPWQVSVYSGIFLMLLGALCLMLFMAPKLAVQ